VAHGADFSFGHLASMDLGHPLQPDAFVDDGVVVAVDVVVDDH
jgi:hypothetical protein